MSSKLFNECEMFEKMASELVFAKPSHGAELVHLFNQMRKEKISVPNGLFYTGKLLESGRGISEGEAIELVKTLQAVWKMGFFDPKNEDHTDQPLLLKDDWIRLKLLIHDLRNEFFPVVAK